MNKISNNVGHLVREFVRPTESFIINQINFLTKGKIFTPIVYAKILNNAENYCGVKARSVNSNMSKFKIFFDNKYYQYIRTLSPFGSIGTLEQIQKDNIKILHLHYLVDARYFLNVIKKTSIPKVVSCYGWDVSNFPKKYYGLGLIYLKPVFKYADKFLAMSNDMKKDLIDIGCPPDKILVHYHGSNVKRFYYPQKEYMNKNNLTILFCGRITFKKGPDVLLKAIRHIQEKNLTENNFVLRIVGSGPLESKLREFVSKNNLDEYVVFVGHVNHSSDQLINEYHSADIFVLPSLIVKKGNIASFDKEGIPGTLVEALASGLPTVSTYHAGIPEVIKHDKNGLLVKEGDVEELANNLSRLINDVDLRERLGKQACFESLNLDINFKNKNLEKIYTDLLDKENIKSKIKK